MMPFKRRKISSSDTKKDSGNIKTPSRFPEFVVFLLERKMGASRRAFLTQLGLKNGFQVENEFSEKVTHVVSEQNSAEEVGAWLSRRVGGRVEPQLLDVSWFTESMKAGRPVEVQDRHRLQKQQTITEESVLFSVPSFACQRRTGLNNHNTSFTEALSLLAENAELCEDDGRGVAFRRAAAVLKALPASVTAAWQLRGLPGLGGHSIRVIKDILENGVSAEVESTKQSERFKALKVLTGIFGVGSKTADRWIRDGIHDLQQLRDSGQILNRAQKAGLDHYDDLNQLVSKAEADAVGEIVRRAVASVSPAARIALTGGFRRGKPTGHDVDFLVTHPEDGREVGLMDRVVSWLESQGFLLYQKTTRNSYLESKDGPGRASSNMDRFERCFSIFKLDLSDERRRRGTEGPEEGAGSGVQTSETTSETKPRRWRAVRVDLVVSPVSQFAFALLGWTGSKLFERELRRWAGQEKNMSLSSHALYDNTQKRYLRASSEEEIFAHLGLDYVPPSERNA